MKSKKRTKSQIFKNIIISVTILVIISLGLYYGGLLVPLQNLFSGQPFISKNPVETPAPTAAQPTAPAVPSPQSASQALEKMAEEAVKNIKKNSVTKISVSPDKKRIAYVSPFDWEVLGEVHLYEVEKKKDSIVVNSSNVKFQHTPKDVEWLDDRYLLVIVGFGYGTVTVGGDLYILDTKENKFLLALTAGERREFKDIYMENGVLVLETAVFNADLTKYTIEKKKLTPAEILAAVKA